MYSSDRAPRYGRQLAVLIVMTLALLVLVGAVVMGRVPMPSTSGALHGSTDVAADMGVSASTSRQSDELIGASLGPSMASGTPTSLPREDHYWLERPVPTGLRNTIEPSYPYGSRGDGSLPIHYGVEIVNPAGTPILAAAPGTIIVAGDDLQHVYANRTDYYGNLVIERLERSWQGQSVYVVYGHMSEVKVEAGQHVEAGDILGLVGMSGVALGPHLHLEVRYGENAFTATVNPELWLEPLESCGTLAGELLSVEGERVPEARLVLFQAESPEQPYREVITYARSGTNGDPSWDESFAVGDLRAGKWLLRASYRGHLYTATFAIMPGATTWVSVRLGQ